jgi:hypothetical protein
MWPIMKPWVAPEKRPSVISATVSPSPRPAAPRHVEHLAHARAALGAFVADDDHVVRLDLALLHRLERVLLALEHARGPAVKYFD